MLLFKGEPLAGTVRFFLKDQQPLCTDHGSTGHMPLAPREWRRRLARARTLQPHHSPKSRGRGRREGMARRSVRDAWGKISVKRTKKGRKQRPFFFPSRSCGLSCACALAATQGDLAKRLGELEEKTEALAMQQDTFSHNTRAQLKQVFEAIRQLMTPPDPPKRPIGFVTSEEKKNSTP